MLALLIKLALAPALMMAATLAARRWGPRLGGIVAAFPAIVGPLLLITALEHGRLAAARAAGGTILGLVALAGFAVAYAATARRRGWMASLVAGWLTAAALSGAAGSWGGHLGLLASTLIACLSLLAGALLLDRLRAGAGRRAAERPALAVRALLTVLLVVTLAAAVGHLGARVGGLLAALPVLASLLTVFTHREAGAPTAIELLRGTLLGMAGFVAFCALIALLIQGSGLLAAFAAATLAAVLIQSGLACRPCGYPWARKSAGRSGEASARAAFNPSASRSAA